MNRPPRRPHIPSLADHRGGKIVVICEKCGMRRRYDATAMLARIGDLPMPSLLMEIARAEGCPRAGNKSEDRCMLHYDLAFAPMFRK
jgi:RNase P subunit RPR2